MRPPLELSRVLDAAYGPQPQGVVGKIHRGLNRAASAIEAGDLCLAGIETVLLALPDLEPSALAKLANLAPLEKWGSSWQDQPRVPAGQSDGGQWSAEDGAAGSSAADVNPATGRSERDSASPDRPAPPLDDGVYRPGTDRAQVVLTGGAEEGESRRSNGPPDDFTQLKDVFPGIERAPVTGTLLAPIDGFFGQSALVDALDYTGFLSQSQLVINDIAKIDPTFRIEGYLPVGGLAGLTQLGRTSFLDTLRMERAEIYYNKVGDVGYLQVETLKSLQSFVDAAYADAINEADAGRLQPRLSRSEAIGNYMDSAVRMDLKDLYMRYGITFGPGRDITVNNRDYDTSSDDSSYRIPDARIRDVSFDWTLVPKTANSPQIRGFFSADSQPRAVIVIRPSQLGDGNTYLITR